MIYNSIWIFLVILQACVTSLPIQDRYDLDIIGHQKQSSPHGIAKYDETVDSGNEQVISVRITSSVAVGRGKEKLPYKPRRKYEPDIRHTRSDITSQATEPAVTNTRIADQRSQFPSDLPSNLVGANVEYIKQLNAKKDSRDYNTESFHPFQLSIHNQQYNENETSANETPTNNDDYDDYLKDIPIGRKVSSASNANAFELLQTNHGYHYSNNNAPADYGPKLNTETNKNVVNETIGHHANEKENRNINAYDNSQIADSIAEPSTKSATVSPSTKYVHNYPNRRLRNDQNNARHTTVSFNIIHDATKSADANGHGESYISSSQAVPYQNQFYNPPKIYSQPAQIYSEPAKFYSEPSKIYSEPAKIYSEPSKVYSEPAKIYSEPAKFYSEPASLHLNENGQQVPPSVPPNYPSWQEQNPRQFESSTINTTPANTITRSFPQASSTQMEHQPEKNYEVEEKISVLTDGRSHGVQESSTEKCKEEHCKTGYVVEGRQYKKYRVEERTSDGFIVGEYGVVRNEDGALRGVRYTADSDASPRLIHDALMKFLQL